MIKITNLNFQTQTIENIQVDFEDIHDVAVKLTKTTFKIVIKKKDSIIKREIKKKKAIESVDLVMVVDKEIEEPVVEPAVEPIEPADEQAVETVVEPVVEPAVEPIEPADEQAVESVVESVIEPILEPVEPVVEPLVMEFKETDIINEILEPVVMEIQEPLVMQTISLGELKELLKQHIPKQNTLDAYVRTIQQVYDHFKITSMNVLLSTKEQEIISYIESQYTNNSTIKSKLCSVYKAYKILNIEGELFKKRIDFYASTQKITHEQTKEENKRTIDEGNEVIKHFENHLEELRAVIQNDTIENDNSLLNNWNAEVQLYCVLKIYLTYGVLRPSELINCLITNTDCDNTTNYINVTSKQIVINNHKNDRKGQKVINIDDNKLLGILRKGIGRFLITNQQGELYQSSSAFSKLFIKHFNYTPYDLRKAVSSKYIQMGDVEQIKKLEMVQGHNLDTILKWYNVYSKTA